MIGSMFGFEGYVNIPEGERVDHVQLRNSGPFNILVLKSQCNDFNLSTYANGAPKEYRSSLTILENGKAILTKDIIVNDPLRYKGISLFQSSYGEMAPERAETPSFSTEDIQLVFFVNASGMVYKRKAEIGKPLEIPEGMGKFHCHGGQGIGFVYGTEYRRGLDRDPDTCGRRTPEVTLPIAFPKFRQNEKRECDHLSRFTRRKSSA